MTDRDAVADVLRRRLDQAAQTQNSFGLLTGQALAEAAALARTVDTDGDMDAESLLLLGWFHWFRYLVLPEGQGADDFEAAAYYLQPIYEADYDGVPEELQQLFAGKMLVTEEDRSLTLALTDSADVSDRAAELTFLLMALQTPHDSAAEPELTRFLQIARQAAAAAPIGHPQYAATRHNLANALHRLFDRTGEIGLLVEALQARHYATDTDTHYRSQADFQDSLGIGLQQLFEHSGEDALLIEAVQAGRQAVSATPDGDEDRSVYLGNLGRALVLLFDRTADLGLLTEAASVIRQGTDETQPEGLAGLGMVLLRLFEYTGETNLLTEAIQVTRRAADVVPSDDPDRGLYLSNLGLALQRMFERTGEIEVITEAVRVGRQAVRLTPDDHADRAMGLNNLGLALRKQFRLTGELRLLTEAVHVVNQAVDATSAGHVQHATYLSNLGGTLGMLFERSGKTEDLVEGIDALRKAMKAKPDDYANRVSDLNDLSLALSKLYGHTGATGPLIEAVAVGRLAVRSTPVTHPGRALSASTLSYALLALSTLTDERELRAEAVRMARLAVEATPEDHPGRAQYLSSLGEAVLMLSGSDQNPAAIHQSIVCFRSASQIPASDIFTRIHALSRFASLAGATSAYGDEALRAMETAVKLLPQISPRTLAHGDREHQAGRLRSLAETAAAAALDAGDKERAVELLEATRGILVAETLDARSSDLAALAHRSPKSAREFEELRNRRELLDRPDHGFAAIAETGRGISGEQDAHDRGAQELARQRLAVQEEWDALLTRIRGEDGFPDFLAAPNISTLTSQAGQGPIVFLTTAPHRCDALILTGTEDEPVLTVQLTGLTQNEAVAQAEKFRRAWYAAGDTHLTSALDRIAAQSEILDVLAWLWDAVAEPVLSVLKYTHTPTDEHAWPRIWWCPVGIMTYLPLHAAGHHRDLTARDPDPTDRPLSVLDLVISSYTPTVRALGYARRHPATGTREDATLIVAVPDAPETNVLRSVSQEADIIAGLIPQAVRPGHPERDEILAALPSHPVAHFACHGLTDWNDPAASRLVLHDHRTHPLTVADITALRLSGALAYLSACDTAVVNPRLTDEALHLTGAFLLAGYQNVIGTLLPVNDTAALTIATDFYTRLTTGGTAPPDTGNSARALHHATRAHRKQYPATPTYWAAHIHTGI